MQFLIEKGLFHNHHESNVFGWKNLLYKDFVKTAELYKVHHTMGKKLIFSHRKMK